MWKNMVGWGDQNTTTTLDNLFTLTSSIYKGHLSCLSGVTRAVDGPEKQIDAFHTPVTMCYNFGGTIRIFLLRSYH
jgi:hypothetical protein